MLAAALVNLRAKLKKLKELQYFGDREMFLESSHNSIKESIYEVYFGGFCS